MSLNVLGYQQTCIAKFSKLAYNSTILLYELISNVTINKLI